MLVRRLREAGYRWPHGFSLLIPLAGLAIITRLRPQPGTRTGRHPAG